MLLGGVLLIAAGISKHTDPEAFELALIDQGVFSTQVPALALFFPAVDFLVGIGAIATSLCASGIRWSSLVLSMFFAVLAVYTAWLVSHPPPKPAHYGCGFRTGAVWDWTPIAVGNGLGAALFALLALNDAARTSLSPRGSDKSVAIAK